MIRTTVCLTALAAGILAFSPANAAAPKAAGCNGPAQEKAESLVDAMADGPNRSVAQMEMAYAQRDYLSGRMASCAVHLARASQAAAAPSYYPQMIPPLR